MWVHAAKQVDKWYRRVFEESVPFMASCQVEEKTKTFEGRVPRFYVLEAEASAQSRGGGVCKPVSKNRRIKRQTGWQVTTPVTV